MAKYTGVVTGRRILLSNADNVPVELVQNDKDTTVIDFELSKIDYVTDLSQLNVTINYVNVDKDTGESVTDIYTVDKTTVEGDTLKFSWTVGSNASVYAGKCIFQLVLTLVDAEGVITQQWDSTKQSIEVHASLENVNVTQPKSFVDFVTQIKKSVSDGKTLVATAITDKGVATEPTDTFEIMAQKIEQIKAVLLQPYIVGNATGYFDTGLLFGDLTRVEIDFIYMTTVQDGSSLFAVGERGTYLGSDNRYNGYIGIYYGSGANSKSVSSGAIQEDIRVNRVVFDNVSKTITMNGNNITSINSSSYSPTIPIFAIHDEVFRAFSKPGDAKLYGFRIYDNDIVVRDYVPAKDADGIVCLYDKVSESYLYDATGANTFVYGEEYVICKEQLEVGTS